MGTTVVARDPTAPYNAKVVFGTMRLPLHELCRIVYFIDHVEDEEFSDMDNEEMFSEEEIDRNEEIHNLARL